MLKQRLQILLACFAILSAAVAAKAMTPHTLMAKSVDAMNLEQMIPKAFADWKEVPDVRVVEPQGSDVLSRVIYNQEVVRGFVDTDGHVVMMLIAYGASQSERLQLHQPEVCYAANGFRVSRPFGATLALQQDRPSLRLTRLVAQREGRFEAITYWMRIGNELATGNFERQALKVKYGLHGLIPDGALIRISTVGLPENVAFAVQSRFIGDLFTYLDRRTQNFLSGDPSNVPIWGFRL